ncbi:MAG: hypothetical protein LBJ64_08015 [Deltaproteobacteria bacterium]|jgi:hypothetical protein|nr:hypothetical protein [Deltaproteobacteria bacterium]
MVWRHGVTPWLALPEAAFRQGFSQKEAFTPPSNELLELWAAFFGGLRLRQKKRLAKSRLKRRQRLKGAKKLFGERHVERGYSSFSDRLISFFLAST